MSLRIWKYPKATSQSELRPYNSITKSKECFEPVRQRKVIWWHYVNIIIERAREYLFEEHIESTYIKLVSQNIRPTIDFVQRIHGTGYPYISNSSVYFDPFKFDKQRTCAQLEADRMDNVAALSERECVLTTSDMTDNGKKNECDFVLWKTSIPRMWP
ncbi:unnamed protein product [Rotaria sp. Silwood1]|nr:unnamed protein product [Rotaria sp. Silwood1]